MGAACELEYQLFLARELTYLDAQRYERLAAPCIEVKRMLAALIRAVTDG